MTSVLKLPTERKVGKIKSPKNLILFGLPKVGKTTAVSELENCLILDLEHGSEYVDAMSVEIDSLRTLKEVGQAILDADRPYKYVVLDTVTTLEDMCLEYARYLYNQTPMGKGYDGNILHLANGGGYLYFREAVITMVDFVKTLASYTILLGHVKDKFIETKGEEFTAKALDLTGKIASLVAADSDAIGYLYRKNDQLHVNFASSDTVVCGSRCQHLKSYNGPLDWSKIYID